jgi:hypothetical protein
MLLVGATTLDYLDLRKPEPASSAPGPGRCAGTDPSAGRLPGPYPAQTSTTAGPPRDEDGAVGSRT